MVCAGMTIDRVMCKNCLCPELPLRRDRPFMQRPYRIGVSPVQLLAALAAHRTSPTLRSTRRCLETEGCSRPSAADNLSGGPLGSSRIAQNLPPARLSNRVEASEVVLALAMTNSTFPYRNM
jgi:hypothetical protein